VIYRGMVMAKDNDIKKDLNEGEDEDLLGFDFDEDLLSEEGEVKEKESEKEQEIIDSVDVAEGSGAPESVEEDTEDLGELLSDEEEVEKGQEAASEDKKEVLEDVSPEKGELKEKIFESDQWEVVSQYPSGKEQEAGDKTVLMERMEGAVGEEPEPSMDLEEDLELDEGLEEILPEDEKEAVEDVSPDKSELKERLFESDQWEVVSHYPSGQEEPGKETVPVKEMEEAVEKETPFKEEATEEVLTEVPAVEGKLEAEEEALPISEERIEALLTKIIREVLEKVAREIMPEVAEKMIRQEIDALKKSIIPED